MLNRCAHKARQVLNEPCGNAGKFLRCPYHGFTYRTDGRLLAVPRKVGYENTSFNEETAKDGLPRVNVHDYRGFIFVKLSDAGYSFEEYFGGSLSSIDNLVDRSPEGELEVVGGCMKFMHECNWKMFIENLNDTCHPMITHEASAMTARQVWEEQHGDEPVTEPVGILSPFVNDLQFYENTGIKSYRHGHAYDGVYGSMHSTYSGMKDYDDAMIAAYGEERAAAILKDARHNTQYLPNLTIKGAIQSIRVARPISANRTLVESWIFRLKGAPEKLLQRTALYNRLINSPLSMVGHDDLHNYRQTQSGAHCGGNEWISQHRNFESDELEPYEERVVGGLSELPMRGMYRSWADHMTMTMKGDK